MFHTVAALFYFQQKFDIQNFLFPHHCRRKNKWWSIVALASQIRSPTMLYYVGIAWH